MKMTIEDDDWWLVDDWLMIGELLIDWLTHWLIAWLTDWLIDCLTDWLTDWLIDWLIWFDWLFWLIWLIVLIDWLIDWLIVWLFDCLIVWLFHCLIVWLFVCLIDWLFDSWTHRLIDSLTHWLIIDDDDDGGDDDDDDAVNDHDDDAGDAGDNSNGSNSESQINSTYDDINDHSNRGSLFFPKPHDERDLFLSFSIYSMAFRCLQDDHLPCYILVHLVQAKLRVSAVSDHAQVSIGCPFIRTVLRGRTLQMARNNTFCIHCLPWTSRRAYSKIELWGTGETSMLNRHMHINPNWFKTFLAFCRWFFHQTWRL